MDPLQKLKRTLPSTGVTSSPHYDPKKLEAGLLIQLIKDKKQLQDVAAIQKEEINRLQSQELKLRAELLINKDENSYLKDENVKLRQLVKALTERLTERMAELSSTLVSRATPTTLESLGAIEVSADVPTTEAPSLDHPQLLLPIPGVPEELASEDGGVDRKPPLDDTDSA